MRTVSATDIRAVLPHILNELKSAGPDATPILVRRHLEPMAVLISFEQFEDYRALIAHRAHDLQRKNNSPDDDSPTDT